MTGTGAARPDVRRGVPPRVLGEGEGAIRSVGVERRLLFILLCAPLLGFVGVVVAGAISNDRIADNLLDAERAGILGSSSSPGPTPLGTTAANYTECTAFSVGLGDPPDAGPITAPMLGTAYTGCERLHAALAEFEETGNLRAGFPYLRYWHGHTVLTRPTLAVTGVAGTRWIAFAAMALAVAGMGFAVKRALGTVTAALLVVPAVLTTDVVIGSLSTSSAIGTGSAWVAGWLSFWIVTKWPEWRIAALTAALAGAITAYFDLMTTMPGSFALTVVGAALGALAVGIGPTHPQSWRVVVAAAVGWLTGLVWMWGSKWVIASLTVGLDTVVDSVRSQISFRLSSGTHGVSTSRMRGLTINLSRWWEQPLTPWVVYGSLAAIVVAAIRWRREPVDQARIALCCGVVAVPVVLSYVVLNNHSQIHPQLVYRSLPITLGAVAALSYAASRQRPRGTADSERAVDVTGTTEPAVRAPGRDDAPESTSDER